MDVCPKRRGQVYTKQVAIRVEIELYEDLRKLKDDHDLDVSEGLRRAIRAFVSQQKAALAS